MKTDRDQLCDRMREAPRLVVTPNRRLPAFAATTSFEAEQFRRLRTRIEEANGGAPVQVVGVTSPGPHEGKTLTAVNLAGALASPGTSSPVLLIDTDLRRPGVWRTLSATPSPSGLMHVLSHGGNPEESVQRVEGTSLDVLPCEAPVADPYGLLTSVPFRGLLQWARARYRAIVLDTPPVVPVPDSTVLGRVVDGYVVVVSANRTPRSLLGEALTMLETSTVLGLVFNRDAQPLGGYARSYRAYFDTAP